MEGQIKTLSFTTIANVTGHTALNGQTVLNTLSDEERPTCMFSTVLSPIAAITTTPNSKVHRSMKENAREIVNCKRRLDFNHAGYIPMHRPQTVAVARRNERERNRVKLINMTFATLREHLPNASKGGKNRKMSKVETLRAAIEYIRYLQQMVDEHDAVNAVFDSSYLSAAGLTAASLTAAGLYQNTAIHSPRPSSCSDSSLEGLSAEEEELVDFANWFWRGETHLNR